MPNGTPTPTPTFTACLDDAGFGAVVMVAVTVTGVEVLTAVVHGIATEPEMKASVDKALGPGIVKLPQPGEAPQAHESTAQPHDHVVPLHGANSPIHVSRGKLGEFQHISCIYERSQALTALSRA
jgi:hypothetical protein